MQQRPRWLLWRSRIGQKGDERRGIVNALASAGVVGVRFPCCVDTRHGPHQESPALRVRELLPEVLPDGSSGARLRQIAERLRTFPDGCARGARAGNSLDNIAGHRAGMNRTPPIGVPSVHPTGPAAVGSTATSALRDRSGGGACQSSTGRGRTGRRGRRPLAGTLANAGDRLPKPLPAAAAAKSFKILSRHPSARALLRHMGSREVSTP